MDSTSSKISIDDLIDIKHTIMWCLNVGLGICKNFFYFIIFWIYKLFDIFHLSFEAYGSYLLMLYKHVLHTIPAATDQKCIENIEEPEYETANKNIKTTEEDFQTKILIKDDFILYTETHWSVYLN